MGTMIGMDKEKSKNEIIRTENGAKGRLFFNESSSSKLPGTHGKKGNKEGYTSMKQREIQ